MVQWTIERSIFFYTLILSIGVYAVLAVNLLTLQGLVDTKNTQLGEHNNEILESILNHSEAMANGTIKTAGLNVTEQNHEILNDIRDLLVNISKQK